MERAGTIARLALRRTGCGRMGSAVDGADALLSTWRGQLVEALEKAQRRPVVLVAASSVGYQRLSGRRREPRRSGKPGRDRLVGPGQRALLSQASTAQTKPRTIRKGDPRRERSSFPPSGPSTEVGRSRSPKVGHGAAPAGQSRPRSSVSIAAINAAARGCSCRHRRSKRRSRPGGGRARREARLPLQYGRPVRLRVQWRARFPERGPQDLMIDAGTCSMSLSRTSDHGPEATSDWRM
jgi:hypothetical protein